MKSFITETIQKIASQENDFVNVAIILPSQRAKVFVKQALKTELTKGFMPEIVTIEEFVATISELKKIDSIELLFHFYSIYKKQEPNPDTFDVFSSWAFTVIQDFNEIDQHLVDTHDIFTYVRDIQRLRKWSVKGTFQETELMKDHYIFLEKLEKYYDEFYNFLINNHIGYQGVLYREATKKLNDYLTENNKKYYFLGFNALTISEEYIFKTMLQYGNTKVYWDIDKSFIENNHQAGRFIRKYLKNWHYYEKNEIECSDFFSNEKNINIIGATKNISQIKYASELLSSLENQDNTALILADENLLPITLNSLPKNIDSVNITMGYPLKNIPTTQLIQTIFQLFLTQEKLGKTTQKEFYYKNVISFFKQGAIQNFLTQFTENIVNDISEEIIENNLMFVNEDFIKNYIPSDIPEIRAIFEEFTSINAFIERILNLILRLKNDENLLEKEFLYRYHAVLTQLKNLQKEFEYFTDLKTLSKFFQQLVSKENLSFQGEPLEGLQLMGMLETRVLDFKNIILSSVNEGILPANSQTNSFIPFDVKQHYKLPTYKEKDAIFSYHFFRLLQRAENIYIIYNTENDAFGKGEKSRFISQLELLNKTILFENVAPKVLPTQAKERIIKKDESIIEKLKEVAEKGISPSAITNYLYNPVKFYQQKVLKIREFDEVEETVAVNTLGTVVHNTLDELYEPLKGIYLVPQDIQKMRPNVIPLINKYFEKYFKNGDTSTGKNRLIYEVAVRFVTNFLDKEEQLLSNPKNKLRIIATEEYMSSYIKVDGLDFPIKIHGNVDRVDELNGVIRIIDYKTGKVDAKHLKIDDLNDVLDHNYHKAIQVMLYSYMYLSKKGFPNQEIHAGVYSFKNLNKGFLQMNFVNEENPLAITKKNLSDFIEQIQVLLKELFSIQIDFKEPLDLPY